ADQEPMPLPECHRLRVAFRSIGRRYERLRHRHGRRRARRISAREGDGRARRSRAGSRARNPIQRSGPRGGARALGCGRGTPARVTIEEHGKNEDVEARLVVGADGRSSTVRKWAGFESKNDPDKLRFAGLLLEKVAAPSDVFYHVAAPGMGFVAYIFPLTRGR